MWVLTGHVSGKFALTTNCIEKDGDAGSQEAATASYRRAY